MTTLRSRTLAGERIIGTFSAIPHPVAVEVCASSGFDFICLDWEHGQFDRGRIEDLLRAAEVKRKPALVRVPSLGSEHIAFALDSGASGVLIPRISTAEQARSAVAAMRYPPVGKRGAGPGRASGYGKSIYDHVAVANEYLLLAIQIETAEGLANIGSIAAVEGIDLIFVGPGDLAVSIGALHSSDQLQLRQAITTIIETCRAANRGVGIFVTGSDNVAQWASEGITFFIMGSDLAFLSKGLESAASLFVTNELALAVAD